MVSFKELQQKQKESKKVQQPSRFQELRQKYNQQQYKELVKVFPEVKGVTRSTEEFPKPQKAVKAGPKLESTKEKFIPRFLENLGIGAKEIVAKPILETVGSIARPIGRATIGMPQDIKNLVRTAQGKSAVQKPIDIPFVGNVGTSRSLKESLGQNLEGLLNLYLFGKGAQVKQIPSVLRTAKEAGLFGAGFGASQALEKEKSPKEILKEAAVSGLLTAPLGVAGAKLAPFLEKIGRKPIPSESLKELPQKPTLTPEIKPEVKIEEVSPIIQEARKYKSAEEFVKAQGQSVYHGTSDDIWKKIELDGIQANKDGKVFFSNTPAYQKTGLFKIGTGEKMTFSEATTKEMILPKNTKIFDINTKNIDELGAGFEVVKKLNKLKSDKSTVDWIGKNASFPLKEDDITKLLKENGYSGYSYKDGLNPIGRVYIISDDSIIKNIKTKSQLTDIWKRANQEIQPIQVSRSQLPVGKGLQKVSRLEARIKGKLEALTPEERTGISTYQQMNKADQIKKAVQYVSKNPAEALQVLKGEKPAPKGILNNSIFLAMEDQASADSGLALKLASLRSTRAGQEISILTERDPHSPVKYMTDLANAKIEALGGKENLTILRNAEMNTVKSEIKKSHLENTDWNAFIDSITC